jgi:hypothetical protein
MPHFLIKYAASKLSSGKFIGQLIGTLSEFAKICKNSIRQGGNQQGRMFEIRRQGRHP